MVILDKNAWQEKLAAMSDSELLQHCIYYAKVDLFVDSSADVQFLRSAGADECRRRGLLRFHGLVCNCVEGCKYNCLALAKRMLDTASKAVTI